MNDARNSWINPALMNPKPVLIKQVENWFLLFTSLPLSSSSLQPRPRQPRTSLSRRPPVHGTKKIRIASKKTRDEDPTFFSTDPDPAQMKKNSGSGSDLKSK